MWSICPSENWFTTPRINSISKSKRKFSIAVRMRNLLWDFVILIATEIIFNVHKWFKFHACLVKPQLVRGVIRSKIVDYS